MAKLLSAAGVDAFGGGQDKRLAARCLHHGVSILQGEEWEAVGLLPEAWSMNLDVAAVKAHGVSKDGLVGSLDGAVHNE